MNDSKFISLLKDKEFLILDGGFATTLELHGHVLDKKLWSAYTTVQSPLSVVDVHEKFIQSGSDVIITSSYQMSYEGFRAKGYDALQTDGFLRRATACAMAACHNMSPRHTAVVAASVGCYGAHLADGSEYSGCYGLSVAELMSWHQRRFEVLCSSGADAIACETVPSLTECTALRNTIALQVQTMQDGPHSASLSGWLSCSCRSGQLLNSGEPFEDAVRTLCDPPHEVESPPLSRWGIGVNCTSPEYVMDLLDVIQDAGGPGGGRPVVVYPNKGPPPLIPLTHTRHTTWHVDARIDEV